MSWDKDNNMGCFFWPLLSAHLGVVALSSTEDLPWSLSFSKDLGQRSSGGERFCFQSKTSQLRDKSRRHTSLQDKYNTFFVSLCLGAMQEKRAQSKSWWFNLVCSYPHLVFPPQLAHEGGHVHRERGGVFQQGGGGQTFQWERKIEMVNFSTKNNCSNREPLRRGPSLGWLFWCSGLILTFWR